MFPRCYKDERFVIISSSHWRKYQWNTISVNFLRLIMVWIFFTLYWHKFWKNDDKNGLVLSPPTQLYASYINLFSFICLFVFCLKDVTYFPNIFGMKNTENFFSMMFMLFVLGRNCSAFVRSFLELTSSTCYICILLPIHVPRMRTSWSSIFWSSFENLVIESSSVEGAVFQFPHAKV